MSWWFIILVSVLDLSLLSQEEGSAEARKTFRSFIFFGRIQQVFSKDNMWQASSDIWSSSTQQQGNLLQRLLTVTDIIKFHTEHETSWTMTLWVFAHIFSLVFFAVKGQKVNLRMWQDWNKYNISAWWRLMASLFEKNKQTWDLVLSHTKYEIKLRH